MTSCHEMFHPHLNREKTLVQRSDAAFNLLRLNSEILPRASQPSD